MRKRYFALAPLVLALSFLLVKSAFLPVEDIGLIADSQGNIREADQLAVQTQSGPKVSQPSSAAKASFSPATNQKIDLDNLDVNFHKYLAEGTSVSLVKAAQMVQSCINLQRFMQNGTAAVSEDASGHFGEHIKTKQFQCSPILRNYRSKYLDWINKGIQEKIPEAVDLYILAGPNGDPDALTQLPTSTEVTNWKRNAMRLLSDAAATGNIERVADLANAYENGVLTERDLVKALGYEKAVTQLMKIQREANPRGREKMLAGLAGRLSPSDVKSAEDISSKFIENYCKSKGNCE